MMVYLIEDRSPRDPALDKFRFGKVSLLNNFDMVDVNGYVVKKVNVYFDVSKVKMNVLNVVG